MIDRKALGFFFAGAGADEGAEPSLGTAAAVVDIPMTTLLPNTTIPVEMGGRMRVRLGAEE